MKLQNAVYYGRIGTILLIVQAAINFIFHLFDLSTPQDYLILAIAVLQIIGFSFLHIFLFKFYKKITDIKN